MTETAKVHFQAHSFSNQTACGRYSESWLESTTKTTADQAKVTCQKCRKAMA